MDDMELESGESDLDSYMATVRTFWSMKTYSGEPLTSVVTKDKQENDIEHKRNGEDELSGPLPSADYVYCTKTQSFLRWNKTSKWLVSMKHQDRWWYIVCAFMTE